MPRKKMGFGEWFIIGIKMFVSGIITGILLSIFSSIGETNPILVLVSFVVGLLLTGLIDVKIWKFEKDGGVLSHFIVGIKHFVASILALIPIVLVLVVVGGGVMSVLLIDPLAGVLSLGIFIIVAIPIMWVITGWVANKLWKWK